MSEQPSELLNLDGREPILQPESIPVAPPADGRPHYLPSAVASASASTSARGRYQFTIYNPMNGAVDHVNGCCESSTHASILYDAYSPPLGWEKVRMHYEGPL